MWKVVLTGSLCLTLAIVLAFLGIFFREQFPWASVTFAVVDIGVVFGGIKAVLETTKTANELRKMELDIRKLQLEIEEKTKAAKKDESSVVIATLEEIKQYALPSGIRAASFSTRITAVVTSVVMILAVSGAVSGIIWQKHQEDIPVAPAGIENGLQPAQFSCGRIGNLELKEDSLILTSHEKETSKEAYGLAIFGESSSLSFSFMPSGDDYLSTDEDIAHFLRLRLPLIQNFRITFEGKTEVCKQLSGNVQ